MFNRLIASLDNWSLSFTPDPRFPPLRMFRDYWARRWVERNLLPELGLSTTDIGEIKFTVRRPK